MIQIHQVKIAYIFFKGNRIDASLNIITLVQLSIREGTRLPLAQ